MVKFYNFLSKKTEEFKPINNQQVGLYTCGPTVYDYVHIGNWRTFVFEDILKRVLRFNGYEVKHVMNLTDIDDKIIKGAKDQGIGYRELGDKYAKAFYDDLEKLNIIKADKYTRATDYITPMIRLIKVLLEKGFAYKGDDGIYFAVEKFKEYGKLSGLEKRQLKKGARVNDDQYDKENWSDFALWKFPHSNTPGVSQAEPSWAAPFGAGRPGWHIECSAMSIAELGESFDLHVGGVDLLFPHHENEIAQSEAATGKKFVNYFLEGEHLLVDGKKMSKSLGNIYTLADIVKKGFDPLALRYLFLTAHYRSKLNFTWESLEAAQNALESIKYQVSSIKPKQIASHSELDSESINKFTDAAGNDLDMPKAVAIFQEVIKSNDSQKYTEVLEMDKVLGLGLADVKQQELPEGVKEMIEKREEIRRSGDFQQSDKMRKELLDMGVEVEDTPTGPKWKITL